MGNKNSKSNSMNTEMHDLGYDNTEYFDEIVNYKDCCGFKIKKVQKFGLIWEQTIIKSCSQLKSQYPSWTEQIIDIVKHKVLLRTPYLKEINELKDLQNQPLLEREQILLSPSEIDQFKDNLKKSILLSSAQAIKSRPKQTSKIQSIIMTPTKKERMKSKNDEILTQFRKSNLTTQSKFDHKREGSNIKTPKSGFRQSMISLVDDTLSSLIKGQDKQISKRSAISLQIFVKFTVIIQKHLSDIGNKLHHIMRCFIYEMNRHYNKPISKPEQMEELVNNVKAFLVILRDAVQDYYNTMSFGDLNQNNNYLISNSENILTVVTAILFKDEKFYNFLFNHVKVYSLEKDKELETILANLAEKSPQYFEIRDQYCLNECTLAFYEDFQTKIDSYYKDGDFPYNRCCSTLNRLQNTKTPISKMKIILESAQKIIDCVRDFYGNFGLTMKNWVLDADQILSIFCYMLTKTSLKHFYSHLFILEHFATENQMISMMGYYYSVMSCALEQLYNNYGSELKQESYSK